MSTKKDQKPDVQESFNQADSFIQRQKSSTKPLNRAIINVLPPLDPKKPVSIELAMQASSIIESLSELSRRWLISINWLYTVCNPNIVVQSNPKYSPVYLKHQASLPGNQFGELSHVDIDGQIHGEKLIGDNRFTNNDFGSAWNDDGFVIKESSNGNPVLDGFTKLISNHITKLQDYYLAKPNRDRHFKAFMIAHTRDVTPDTTNSEPKHKSSHIHVVLDLPTQRSRYQIMQAMGFHFEDFIETFNWIAKRTGLDKIKRLKAFFNILESGIHNYTKPDDLNSALQYLVHQSKQSIEDQKTPYKTEEVISWLPDDADTDYEHLAGVFNNDIIATGANAAVTANLQSPYNKLHNTAALVGNDKVFSLNQLTELRNLAKKQPGSFNLTKHSKAMLLSKLMNLIRSEAIQPNEWITAIHAALDDNTADLLIGDKSFTEKLDNIIDHEIKAIINDPHHDRHMTTIFIVAAKGGIGKTRLATALAKHYDKGRTPHFAAARDKNKTYDAYQNYEGQMSSVIDEIDPSAISITQLKDILDPHKTPSISSRNNNVTAYNSHHTFLTNVYEEGIGEYIKQVMLYAPGSPQEGYLEKDRLGGYHLIKDSPEAVNNYIAGLSQLVRRIPIVINMAETPNHKGTRVTVSRINFKPSGQSITRYDYVHDDHSDRVIRRVINDSLPESDMQKIAKFVADLIDDLNQHADAVFQQNPSAILSENNGFIPDEIDMGITIKNNQTVFTNDNSSAYILNNNYQKQTLIDKLNKLTFMLKPGKHNPKMDSSINQMDALLKGLEVPFKESGYSDHQTISLTDTAKQLVSSGQMSEIITELATRDDIYASDHFFKLNETSDVYAIKTK